MICVPGPLPKLMEAAQTHTQEGYTYPMKARACEEKRQMSITQDYGYSVHIEEGEIFRQSESSQPYKLFDPKGGPEEVQYGLMGYPDLCWPTPPRGKGLAGSNNQGQKRVCPFMSWAKNWAVTQPQ